MNEQLQAALTKLIEQVSSGAAVATAQLPEALQQYIAFSRESSIKMMIICGVIAAVLLVCAFISSLRASYSSDGELSRFILYILAAIAVVFGVVYYNQYMQTFYPQAFVLDMLRGMLTK